MIPDDSRAVIVQPCLIQEGSGSEAARDAGPHAGVDHKRLIFKFQGRHFRLTDVAGNLVPQALA